MEYYTHTHTPITTRKNCALFVTCIRQIHKTPIIHGQSEKTMTIIEAKAQCVVKMATTQYDDNKMCNSSVWTRKCLFKRFGNLCFFFVSLCIYIYIYYFVFSTSYRADSKVNIFHWELSHLASIHWRETETITIAIFFSFQFDVSMKAPNVEMRDIVVLFSFLQDWDRNENQMSWHKCVTWCNRIQFIPMRAPNQIAACEHKCHGIFSFVWTCQPFLS